MKSIVVALISLFLLAAAPAASSSTAPPPSAGDADIYQTTLANGLRVIVAEDHSAPVVQTNVWYRFGSIDERAGDYGLAHALEHMMFRGTTDLSSGGLDSVVAQMGAQMNASTTYDYTQFYFLVPADKTDVALAIEADRMHKLALAPDQWNIERRAVLNELDGDATSPFYSLLSRVRAAAYPNAPIGRTPAGSRADVARAKVSGLRYYYSHYYAPNNATLVVTGDVQHAQVFKEVQHLFGEIPMHRIPAQPTALPKAVSGATVEAEFPSPFEVLDLAYAIPGDVQVGEPAISTLATLINDESAPFYQALVTSNVALGVQASADTQLRGGLLNVFIVINPGHNADEAQTIFQSTMQDIIAHGISSTLARDARNLTIAQRLYSADSINGLGALVGYTYGIVNERISDEDARLAALSASDLQAAAKHWLAIPTVVGHLRPTDTPPKRTSSKASATMSDSFGGRAPQGPVIIPAKLRTAAATPTRAQSVLKPYAFTLPNGLHVLFQRKSDRPTFVITGEIASSQAFAPKGQVGIDSLASTLADYGSNAYPFARRRAAIDGMGAYLTTGAQFSAQGTGRDFARILAILGDGEQHPSFAQPWFSLFRGQLANSIASSNHLASVLMQRAYLHLLLAPADPVLRAPTRDGVMSITRHDLRSYTASYWRPDLTTISIVGDLQPSAVKATVARAFGNWHAKGATPDISYLPLPPARGGRYWIETASRQVNVHLGMPAIAKSDPDYEAAAILTQILGGAGSFESRLWQHLRQRNGIVYSVNSTLSSNYYRGDLTIDFSTPPQRVALAMVIVRAQLDNLRTHPVSARALQDARRSLLASSLLDEASSSGQADQLLSLAENHLPLDAYRTLAARLARITPADVQRVARRILHPNHLARVYVGPRGPWSTPLP